MIYMVRLLAYILMDDNEEEISLINMENTKWCNSTLTMSTSQYIQCYSLTQIQKFSHSTKVGTQYKVWGCI